MKSFATAALDAIEAGTAIVSGSVEFYGTPNIFLFGGHGSMDLPSDLGTSTFKGLGGRALIRMSGGSIGGAADNITLVLSGVDPEAIAVLDASEISGEPAVIRRLVFDSAGQTLLGSNVFTRGRVDTVNTRNTIGGDAAIEVMIESAARGLGRRGSRMRSDADQRLINAADGFFKNVSYAAQKTLYWGGKRPATAGSALGGGSGGNGGVTNPCITEDTPQLMANAERNGPGEAKPIGEAKVGEWIWTRHHLTGEWGAFQIVGHRRSWEPVYRVPGLPRATKLHRTWCDEPAQWAMLHADGEPDGHAWVIKETVAEAHTYFTPGGGEIRAEGVLNHNIKSEM